MLISAHLHTTLDGKLVKIIKRIRSSLNDVPLAHICIMISKYSGTLCMSSFMVE